MSEFLKIPLIDLHAQHKTIRKEILKALTRIMDSQKFVLSDSVKRLESEVAKKTGSRFAVGLASGSDALYLALAALGIGPGDEVITTPFTFFATAGSISRTGATPVFADIDPKTFNLDPSKIEARITPRTKAILPVHLFGLICDMDAIGKIAKKHSLSVIEDAAQAFGTSYKKKQAGSIGDVGCFSFYPTKNLGGAGDGGMAVTSSETIAQKLRLLRDHGSFKKYYHEVVGINSRLDELQAAVLLVKLKYIDRWNKARQHHAGDYEKGLRDLPVMTPKDGGGHIFHLYSILSQKRDELVAYLQSHGVGAGVYYPLPLHLQPCYKNLRYKPGDFPRSENISKTILSLPIYPETTSSQKKYIISTIRTFFKSRK